MKKHNFYAGPSILSEYTIKNTAAAVENFKKLNMEIPNDPVTPLLGVYPKGEKIPHTDDNFKNMRKEIMVHP